MKPLLLILGLLTSSSAFAYYDVLDTGEIMAKGNYKLTGGAQLLTDEGGANGEAIFDAGFSDEFGGRATFGLGRTDIFAGALFKWMPIPDIDNQPAIGFNVGLLYGKANGNRDLTFRFEPLVSKKIDAGSTVWTPYASIPLGLRSRDSEDNGKSNDFAWQLVGGTQLQIEKWKKLQFMAEIGVDLGKAVSHVSVAAVFYFDEEKGMVLE